MRLELTRRTDYAIRALVALAQVEPHATKSATRIAAETAVPAAFLTRVLQELGKSGFVKATAGRAGGYRLARRATDVVLYDVIEALEGDRTRRRCVLEDRACDPDRACGMHGFWAAASRAFRDELAAVTLASVSQQSLSRQEKEP